MVGASPSLPDVDLQWTRENTASGGYRIYRTTNKQLIPMERAGEADEIAEAIAWLCSPESSYVTGALLDASGGR